MRASRRISMWSKNWSQRQPMRCRRDRRGTVTIKTSRVIVYHNNPYSYGHLSVVSTNKNPFIECIIP
jgi:hypothetical protein